MMDLIGRLRKIWVRISSSKESHLSSLSDIAAFREKWGAESRQGTKVVDYGVWILECTILFKESDNVWTSF